MKVRCILAAVILPLACSAGEKAPKIDWQTGPCRGGNQPSLGCRNCQQCAYCGRWKGKVVKDHRPANSATCIVCERRKVAR